jgi:hypothetical protein
MIALALPRPLPYENAPEVGIGSEYSTRIIG